MRTPLLPVIAALLLALGMGISAAQQAAQLNGNSQTILQTAKGNRGGTTNRTLSPDEGLSVIAAALDSKVRLHPGRDCSHLVHAIYQRAGFPYSYASSDDLYVGVEGFRRVAEPQPGDLIVWRGHAGIVVRPSGHVFFSFLSAGPGIDDYQTHYWRSRGRPRFYRYVKNNSCAGCTSASAAFRRNRNDK
jgi:cell wall-associated NlpC family hydrolase